jgi:hypothetical protein
MDFQPELKLEVGKATSKSRYWMSQIGETIQYLAGYNI